MSEESTLPFAKIQHHRKRAMLDALKSTLGIVSPACEKVGIDRATHYNWLKGDPDYAEAVQELVEMQIDFVESQLLTQIKNGDNAPTIFFLKTRARSRGYVEHDDLAGEGVPEWVISRIKKPE